MHSKHELAHAGPKPVAREAELPAPTGVVCSDLFDNNVTMNSKNKINPAHHQATEETKTWLYNVSTFRGGDKIYPFVLNLGIEELAQLHALLQLHADDLSNEKGQR